MSINRVYIDLCHLTPIAVQRSSAAPASAVIAIRDLLDATAEQIRRDAPRVYSRELAEIVFVQPYCRISNLVDAKIAQRQSASAYLKALVGIGVLEEIKAGRERLFINPALLKRLNDDHGG